MKHLLTYLVLLPSCALVCGCGVHRNLKITEVMPNQVELYLDEPASNRLDLTNMKLKWTVTDPTATPSVTTGELDLGVAGSLQGGQFLVIFENANYSDVPVAQAFHGPIAGIKVKDGFFPPYGGSPSAAMTVDGSHYRSFVVFVPVYQDKVNDVVTFGPSPRPSSGGAFTEDGTLNNTKPSGTQSISRAFTGNTPVDTDKESDWSQKVTTPGAPTGP